MATECDRANLARVAEVASDFSPTSRRSALVARTNAASMRGPALAGKGSASIPVTSSNSMSRRRTDMGALLEADMGPDVGGCRPVRRVP
jgi:hypothetical protein